MDEMRCSDCNKIIYQKPCLYCGCENVIYSAPIKGQLGFSGDLKGVIVKGSSEVNIKRGGQSYTHKFDSDVSSSYIVDESLTKADLSKATPNYVRDQIIYNIDRIEQFANENPANKITHEHAFELNLGVFKYTYKKTIEKPE